MEGTVKFFLTGIDKKTGENQNYGFINVTEKNGESKDVFFHKYFGGEYYVENGAIKHRRWEEGEPGFIPASGDLVEFEYEKGDRGLRATRWGSVMSYNNAKRELEAMDCYRLIKRVGTQKPHPKFKRDNVIRNELLWEGRDIGDVQRKFPAEDYPVRSETGYYIFFQQLVNGQFVDIENDPRLAWIELEADAEVDELVDAI